MRTSRSVTIAHPDVKVRIALRSILEAHGCTVNTDHCLRDLASTEGGISPDLILVDRGLLEREGIEILTELSRKWRESVPILLPEGLTAETVNSSSFGPQFLAIVDRMLGLALTRDILTV
jgi:DNA-binding response OmpR family regulator